VKASATLRVDLALIPNKNIKERFLAKRKKPFDSFWSKASFLLP
jgi:hypothetical protein